ncbi:chaperonin 10-like protein [Mycena latifolia]|nr:chaperonin 10-like protein [Mycena latifolia]
MSVEFTVFKGSANEGIMESKTHHAAPTGNHVLVKITHSGICGTDEHYKHADEGVGTVQQIGESVKGFNVGDIVGWGYTHKTCGTCEQCLLGQDQYCTDAERYGTHNFHQGSFGSHAIWDASFLFKVPEGLAPEHAAPLMCGGATVFEVIESYNIRPTDHVGVIGIGGLGHLAIQFLAKMGASVVVFSSTESKREEALRLGATEFYATKSVEKFEMGSTISCVMKAKGTVYPLTISFGDLVMPSLPILLGGITIQGSAVAARSHQIEPVIEPFPLTKSGVGEGMSRLREDKMRYRAVLIA